MNIYELILIGAGLAMDAFAIAICKGLGMKKLNLKQTTVIALFFGGFQALMPFIGWILGKQFESLITNIDHWIAFVLLGFIGGKMIYEALTEKDECCECNSKQNKLDIKELFIMAVATSIDALAVGITFAFYKVNIALASSTIGLTTFIISALGVVIGHKFGKKFKNKAGIVGGIILIAIGIKILVEDLGILIF